MHMFWLDIILIIWLVSSAIGGYKMGFVYKLGSLIGLVLSIYLAIRWTPGVIEYFGWGVFATITVFLIVMSLLSKLFGIIAWGIDKMFHIIYIIPFLKTFNRALGAGLGVLVTILMMTAVVAVSNVFSFYTPLTEFLGRSTVVPYVTQATDFALPYLQDAFSQVVSFIQSRQ